MQACEWAVSSESRVRRVVRFKRRLAQGWHGIKNAKFGKFAPIVTSHRAAPGIELQLCQCAAEAGGQKRVYICGDHTCANNKEVKDYFNNNISIEVYTITSDKKNNKNFSLVDLNLMRDKLNEKKKIQISDKEEMLKEHINERKKWVPGWEKPDSVEVNSDNTMNVWYEDGFD